MAVSKKKAIKPIPFNVRLVGVSLLGINLPVRIEPIPDGTVFQFNMKIEQRFYLEQNIVLTIFNLKISDTPTNDNVYCEITTSCTFHIKEDLKAFQDTKTEKISLPENGRLLMNSLTISTSRGMIASELNSTYLQGVILPIVDPTTFV